MCGIIVINKAKKSFYYQPILKAIAKNGSERLGVQAITKSWTEDMPNIKMEVTFSANTFEELNQKIDSFFDKSEMVKCEYYLCSEVVNSLFKPFEASKPFQSGYDFDKRRFYYVAWLNFEEVEKYYNEVVKPHNDRSDNQIDYWCRECSGGTMEVSKISMKSAKKNGLFVEIENKIGLTNSENRAYTIKELSNRYGCTPVELINKYL